MYSNATHGIRVYTHRNNDLKSSTKMQGVTDRDKYDRHLSQKINNGNYNLWCDNWTCMGNFAIKCHGFVPENGQNMKVSEYIIDGAWIIQGLYKNLPSLIALCIITIEIGDPTKNDYIV